MPRLSVVTVVKDDLEGFTRSQESLARQSAGDVEWVVVDSSADRTDIAAAVEKSGLVAIYRHEQARGIYAAMNSALDAATGDFVYFLNAGDTLASPTVLQDVGNLLGKESVWGFGPVEIAEQGGVVVVTPSWDYAAEQRWGFSRGHFPPHQGTFVRRDTLLSIGGFDTSYRIAADYAAFLRLSQLRNPIEFPFVIARFKEGGTSTLQWRESFREFHRARRQILRPQGLSAVRERMETARHFALVYAHREVRPRLSWPRRRTI